MQKMYNLNKWSRLDEGSGMQFHNERPRVVRLDVNSPDRAVLYVLQRGEDGETGLEFLARVEGRDVVEFVSSGPFELTCEGGPVAVYTIDGEDISFRELAPVIFTKIVERRKRSPELEYIAAMMSKNMERRLAQQANEFRGLFERSEAARAKVAANPNDVADVRKVPEPDHEGKPRKAKASRGTDEDKARGEDDPGS